MKRVLNSKGFKVALGVSIAAAGTYAAYRLGKRYMLTGAGRTLRKSVLNDIALDMTNAKYSNLKADGEEVSKKLLKQMARSDRQQMKQSGAIVDLNRMKLKSAFRSVEDIPKTGQDYARRYMQNGSKDAYKVLVKDVNGNLSEEKFYSALFNDPGSTQNCTHCTAAMVMRMKGYDVNASKTRIGSFSYSISNWFDNCKFIKPKTNSSRELYEAMMNSGDGHYGMLNVFFKDTGGGHSIFYVVKNGGVEIIDGQISKSYGRNLQELNENLFSRVDVYRSEFADLTHSQPTKKILKSLSKAGTIDDAMKQVQKAARTERKSEIVNSMNRKAANIKRSASRVVQRNKSGGTLDDNWVREVNLELERRLRALEELKQSSDIGRAKR